MEKVIKSAENFKFHVAESFLCNFGGAGENFGLRKDKQLKRAFKKVKSSQKRVTKTTDTFTFPRGGTDLDDRRGPAAGSRKIDSVRD